MRLKVIATLLGSTLVYLASNGSPADQVPKSEAKPSVAELSATAGGMDHSKGTLPEPQLPELPSDQSDEGSRQQILEMSAWLESQPVPAQASLAEISDAVEQIEIFLAEENIYDHANRGELNPAERRRISQILFQLNDLRTRKIAQQYRDLEIKFNGIMANKVDKD